MTLQDTFYTVSILSNLLFIFILLFIGFAIWQMYLSIHKLQENVSRELKDLKQNTIDKAKEFVDTPKSEIASMVGIGLGSFLLSQVKKAFKR